MNSEGWKVKPPMISQRAAPLAVWPMNGRDAITPMAAR